jgi:hypothetical protein
MFARPETTPKPIPTHIATAPSIITLGVFLREHLIAEVRNDALTKTLIRPGWDDLVQPKQSVVLDDRQ